MADGDLVGTFEAAEVIKIERSTLSRWVASGRITPVQQLPGRTGAMLFKRADVERLANEWAQERSAKAAS